MVAVSFGSYASEAVADGSTPWVKAFAVLVVLVMSLLNILGSRAVANAQTVVVIVVIGILTVFAVTTLANIELDLLSFSGYPSVRDIVSSVALTFFGLPRLRCDHLHREGPGQPRARPAGARRDGSAHVGAGPGHRHHRRRAAGVRVHHPGRRARDRSGPGGDPAAEHRPGRPVEAKSRPPPRRRMRAHGSTG